MGDGNRLFGQIRQTLRSRLALMLLVAFSWILISSTLSPNWSRALESAAQMLLVAGLGFAMLTASDRLPSQAVLIALSIGISVAAFLLIANKLVMPNLRAGYVPLNRETNRIAALITLFVPVLNYHLLKEKFATSARVTALALLASAIFLSDSESAKFGLIVALIVYVLCTYGAGVFRGMVAAGMVFAIMLMPLLMLRARDIIPQFMFDHTEYQTFEIRTLIWREFASLTMQKPIFGYGVEASRIASQLPEAAELGEVHRTFLLFPHTHNDVLQIWFELGAIGALLTAALIWSICRWTEHLPPANRNLALTLIAAVFAVSCVSHGLWQAWWPCAVFVVLLAFPRSQRSIDGESLLAGLQKQSFANK